MIVAGSIVSVSQAQDAVPMRSNQSATSFLKLKGTVKSLREIAYETKDSAGKVLKGKKMEDGNRQFLFNERGHVSAIYEYTSNGKINYHDMLYYDVEGKLVKKWIIKDGDSLGGTNIFKYDSLGNTSELNIYNPSGSLSEKWVYKQDRKGNVIEEVCYLKDTLYNRLGYSYDETGKCLSFDYYLGKKLDQSHKYEYDSAGRLYKDVTYSASGEQTGRQFWTYDNFGNVVLWVNAQGLTIDNWTYTYLYDGHHNWIRKIGFKDKKKSNYLIERKIEYYPNE